MQSAKDHYHVLNVSPNATTEEIKKAFRKLALRYHPDKNDALSAAAAFASVQEAYYVLSDRKRRADYHYQRYRDNPLHFGKHIAYTAAEVLQLSKQLHKIIPTLDPFRIDRDILYFQLTEILSDHNLVVLHTEKDVLINSEIVIIVLPLLRHLSMKDLKGITDKLATLVDKESSADRQLQETIGTIKQQYYWDRYKIYIALAIAVLFCSLLFLAGK
ncbi:MAG: DnaJ domain-containing protein [Bacteroidota bacterium]